MRVAFIGVGYFPTRTAGEKNFYLKLLPLIRAQVDDVIVLSVNGEFKKYTHRIRTVDQSQSITLQDLFIGAIRNDFLKW